MKTDNGLTSVSSSNAPEKYDSSKLVSLLALAAGAAAVPQTSEAMIVADTPGFTVAWESGSGQQYSLNLLGLLGGNVAQMAFQAHQAGFLTSTSARWITGGQKTGYIRFRSALPGQNWNQAAATSFQASTFAVAKYSSHGPDGYGGAYLDFRFKDSGSGNAWRYGWIELDLSNGDLRGLSDYPQLTIDAYAYETTGVVIAAGQTQVPEPSPAALLALGAMALGAKGVRTWRRNRPQYADGVRW
jgi:hypothetical protein